MSLDDGLASKTPYLDAVSTALPSILSDLLMSFDIYTRDKLDTLVRFCAGGGCPPRIAGHASAWVSGQTRLQQRLSQLDPSTGEKRPREENENGAGEPSINGSSVASKRPKLAAAAAEDGAQDTESLFTLHSLSITAPVRKKVDISITAEAIRLTNSTNRNLEARIPLNILKRTFIVSSLGKNRNKEQWAVTLMSADNFDKKADATNQAQLAFNIDKVVPGGKDGFKTTAGADAEQESHTKGDETLPLLHTFLSHLPPHIEVHTAEKGSQAFKSSSGQPYVDAYLGAKEGALCFLPQGILWANVRPCAFYALEDLAPDSDTPQLGGVKTLSATGRTFSVFVRRRGTPATAEQGEGGSDYGDTEEGEETEFAMIDGRELENVNAWIRKYRHQFGKPRDVKGKGKARADPQEEAIQSGNADDSDASDDDYAAPSDSDGGEPSSDEESSDDEGVQTVDEEEAEEGDDEGGEQDEDDEEDEEDEELDPARHPLLRPGAMPKMSVAAMNAAVTMVTQDMLGSKRDDADNDEDEEEVDELE